MTDASLFKLFATFSKIGLFTIGGGYAMIPLIERDVVERNNWVGKDDFLDLLAVAQSAPGVFAVNIAIFIGYKLRGVRGAVAASLGSVIPSVVCILLIALFFHSFRHYKVVEHIFWGLRPAVVALIAAPVFSVARSARITRTTVWVPILAALLIVAFGVSPIYIILCAGVAGFLYGKIKGRV
ncbi:MAG: chromate transporter [Bacteroidales bacterium]|nr:chromate transporter [Bacteroidales bacterium]